MSVCPLKSVTLQVPLFQLSLRYMLSLYTVFHTGKCRERERERERDRQTDRQIEKVLRTIHL